ncbi:MAG: methylated-DNA--[protein]-cysteine S-methyltransferase [Micropepsaceae bacterium]
MKRPASHSSSAALAQIRQNWSISPEMDQACTLFTTAIGTCAVAWGPKGIIGVSLPADDSDVTRAFISRRFPDAQDQTPPVEIAAVIADIQSLLAGESRDLLNAQLDLDAVPEFHRRVYEVTRLIPPGQTMTYGQIAEKLEAPGTSRAVGQALGANPFPIIVPCHRILASSGGAGGFSAPGGLDTKLKMLNIERLHAPEDSSLFGSLPLAVAPRRPRGYSGGRRRLS